MPGRLIFGTTSDGGTGATERLRITSDGFVGINENTPSRHLHVNSGASDIIAVFESSDTSAQIQIKDSNGTCTIECLNDFRFQNGSAEILRLKSDKDVQVMDGNLILASGHGIDFGATGDSAGNQGSSELLDDYEEGSWTPAFKAGNNSTACPTSVSHAKYTRVGRLVVATAYFTMTSYASGTTGGDTRIVGLPYTNIGEHGGVAINYWWSLKQNVSFMAGTVQGNTSQILIRGTTSAAVGTANIDFDNTFGPVSYTHLTLPTKRIV